VGIFGRKDPLESRLRSAFEPREAFADDLRERVVAATPRQRFARASRTSFAAAVAVFMLGTFASFGGVSLAAAGAKQTVHAVAHVTISQKPIKRHATSASDQYGNAAPTITTKAKPPKQTKPVTGKISPTTLAVKPKGTLPFTGFSLLATMLASLVLIGLGVAFRRAGAVREQRQ
jgi:hypothetical protein